MKVTIFVFDNYTALDLIGPYEVLSRIPGAEILLAGLQPGLYKDGKGMRIYAGHSIVDIESSDIVVIPGGFGIDAILNNTQIIDWLTRIHSTSRWTVSVCSGSLLLGAAGLLNGKKATTHWNRKEQLKEYGAEIVDRRYVQDGKIITSAGVSAGIDMSLYLVSKLLDDNAAMKIQLGLEYAPQPPFDAGTPDKAPKEIVDQLIIKKLGS